MQKATNLILERGCLWIGVGIWADCLIFGNFKGFTYLRSISWVYIRVLQAFLEIVAGFRFLGFNAVKIGSRTTLATLLVQVVLKILQNIAIGVYSGVMTIKSTIMSTIMSISTQKPTNLPSKNSQTPPKSLNTQKCALNLSTNF